MVDFVTSSAGLPAQSGQAGKYLTTIGNAASWASVDALPAQSGNSGKLLTTNGTTASWVDGSTLSYITDKLTKVTSANKVYATNGSGAQMTYSISNSNGNSTVALRTSTGQLRASAPTADNDVVILSYLNTQLGNYQTTANMESSLSSSTTNYPSSKAVKDVTDTLAVDNDVVHLAGDETITGIKTISHSSPNIIYKSTTYQQGTAVTSDTYIGLSQYKDKDGNYVARDYTMIGGGGNTVYYIKRLQDCSTSGSSSSTYKDVIKASYNGTSANVTFTACTTVDAPTPTDTTSTASTQIATVGWVNTV